MFWRIDEKCKCYIQNCCSVEPGWLWGHHPDSASSTQVKRRSSRIFKQMSLNFFWPGAKLMRCFLSASLWIAAQALDPWHFPLQWCHRPFWWGTAGWWNSIVLIIVACQDENRKRICKTKISKENFLQQVTTWCAADPTWWLKTMETSAGFHPWSSRLSVSMTTRFGKSQ